MLHAPSFSGSSACGGGSRQRFRVDREFKWIQHFEHIPVYVYTHNAHSAAGECVCRVFYFFLLKKKRNSEEQARKKTNRLFELFRMKIPIIREHTRTFATRRTTWYTCAREGVQPKSFSRYLNYS